MTLVPDKAQGLDEALLDAPADKDYEIAARLTAGDPDALAETYRLYAGLVFGLARRILGSQVLAEDVTQEVFTSLWQRPDRFDPTRGTLRCWLGLLAHRRSVDRVRSEVRRANYEARYGQAASVTWVQNEAEDRLNTEWLADRVRQALADLPDDQRDAVVLAYYGGRTYRQVAVELVIPEGTAKSRLRLAMHRLNELLRPALAEEESLT